MCSTIYSTAHITAVVWVHNLLLPSGIMSQLVLGGMAKGHELILTLLGHQLSHMVQYNFLLQQLMQLKWTFVVIRVVMMKTFQLNWFDIYVPKCFECIMYSYLKYYYHKLLWSRHFSSIVKQYIVTSTFRMTILIVAHNRGSRSCLVKYHYLTARSVVCTKFRPVCHHTWVTWNPQH